MWKRAKITSGGGGVTYDCLAGTVPDGTTSSNIEIPRPAQLVIALDRNGMYISLWSPAHQLNGSYTNYLVCNSTSTDTYFNPWGVQYGRLNYISPDFKTMRFYSYGGTGGTDYWIYY